MNSRHGPWQSMVIYIFDSICIQSLRRIGSKEKEAATPISLSPSIILPLWARSNSLAIFIKNWVAYNAVSILRFLNRVRSPYRLRKPPTSANLEP